MFLIAADDPEGIEVIVVIGVYYTPVGFLQMCQPVSPVVTRERMFASLTGGLPFFEGDMKRKLERWRARLLVSWSRKRVRSWPD
eukprot:2344887-Amphidinium_carterae.1